jgi:16S rRNA (uracil1498-N3)-methyltransferase
MRLQSGAQLLVFNENEGEFLATLKKDGPAGFLILEEQRRRVSNAGFEIHLAFSPLKPHLTSLVVEKATELGVTHIHPVIMERTQIRHINTDRLQKIATEAAEQSERLTLPLFTAVTPLCDFLSAWHGVYWLSAIERSNSGIRPIIGDIAAKMPQSIGVIIGPEGGFSHTEIAILQDKTTPVSLGEQILRSETAAICALSWVILSK